MDSEITVWNIRSYLRLAKTVVRALWTNSKKIDFKDMQIKGPVECKGIRYVNKHY